MGSVEKMRNGDLGNGGFYKISIDIDAIIYSCAYHNSFMLSRKPQAYRNLLGGFQKMQGNVTTRFVSECNRIL